MRLDSTLAFTPIGGQTLVGGAGVSIPSTNVIDLLGSGVGTAPPVIIGNATTFGEDIGTGDGFLIPKLQVSIGDAATTSNAATLNIQLQAAPDTGSAGGYQPGTWQTIVETGPLTAAQLTKNSVAARFDIPPVYPANLRPRYMRLVYAPLTATNFTAGTIAYAGIVPARDDTSNLNAAANYKVL